MIRNYILIITLLTTLVSYAQKVNISIDYTMLEEFVEIYENGNLTENNFNTLLASDGTKGLLKKMKTYFPNANEDTLKNSLLAVLGNSDANDVFMYKRVIKKMATASGFMKELKEQDGSISSKIEQSLADFLPKNKTFNVKIFIMFSAIGGGWTFDDEANTFYVDASLLDKNDLIGFQYLCTHEILHLIQNLTREKIDKANTVQYFLEQAFREGMATYIADFSKIKNAKGYAEFNQKIYKKNKSRSESNYKLFELLIHGLSTNSFNYDDADKIAFSGMYDSPAYFVFYDMINVMESIIGKKKTLEKFNDNVIDFITYYQTLAKNNIDKNVYQFSKQTINILNN